MSREIKIFDTTLRDGEQSPGCSMNLEEKITLAKQLEKLGVDIIEAGFPIASPGDFKAVSEVAKNIKNCTVAGLARALEKDIDRAYEAVKYANYPRIHTFIATSDIHMKYKLRMTEEEVLERTRMMVSYAKKLCSDIEFSAEDASRSNPEFLYKVFYTAIDAGATVINVPDTVGYTMPEQYSVLIKGIRENVSNIDKAQISVHCHNDLGMAVANTLAAAYAGATQLECTVNGIGERAGNAALEEIAMSIATRKDYFDMHTNINTKEIYKTSKLVSSLTGSYVQANKAIVGKNAFAHESGIHQHGVLANKNTYEIMTPESIGLSENKMVLGKHSGKHAFKDRLVTLGYNLEDSEIEILFAQFKILADKKKTVSDLDIEAMLEQKNTSIQKIYSLERFVINSGNTINSTAVVKLMKDEEIIEEVSTGDGPVDAVFNAIEKIVGLSLKLENYSIKAITEGKDAQGSAIIKLEHNDRIYNGRGLSTDIVEASAKAYINAVNKILLYENKGAEQHAE